MTHFARDGAGPAPFGLAVQSAGPEWFSAPRQILTSETADKRDSTTTQTPFDAIPSDIASHTTDNSKPKKLAHLKPTMCVPTHLESLVPQPVSATFDRWQRERLVFVKTLIDIAQKPQNKRALKEANIVGIVRPLLLDEDEAVQQAASLALWMVLGASPAPQAAAQVSSSSSGSDVDLTIKQEPLEPDMAAIHDVLDRYYMARRQFSQDLFSAAAKDSSLVPILKEFVAPVVTPLLEDVDDHVRELAVAASEILELGITPKRVIPGRSTTSNYPSTLSLPKEQHASSDSLAGSSVAGHQPLPTPPPSLSSPFPSAPRSPYSRFNPTARPPTTRRQSSGQSSLRIRDDISESGNSDRASLSVGVPGSSSSMPPRFVGFFYLSH